VQRKYYALLLACGVLRASPVWAEPSTTALDLELDANLIQSSPVLQRWLEDPPDLLSEMQNTPVLPTRIQAAVETSAWSIGLQDLRIGQRLTLSGDYRQSFDDPEDYQLSSSLRYYLSPLGNRFNLAPQIGYAQVEQADRSLSGLQLGAFVVIALAPKSADITLSYNWIDSTNQSGTLAQITTAYALNASTRLAARYRWQNSTLSQDRNFAFVLEWTP
jgi:hypothetical protein